MKFETEQEEFWAGEFGNEYINRNKDLKQIANNLYLFSRILKSTSGISSVIEYGANIGLNLIALNNLLPNAKFSAVEINKNACYYLEKHEWIKIYNESILNFSSNKKYDFVFTKGVLIHIAPQQLSKVYEILYSTSKKYILLAEYYNPTPVELNYRNNKDRLFKRDFCSELLGKHPDLELIDYGFIYHNDKNFPQDDLSWFLIKKTEE